MTPALGRLPSLNALRAFEAASRHLNFRLAAEELGVTQGAVAQQVRALEADLGLQLFERRPRTLALTAQGQRYMAGVRPAFELLVEATQALRPQLLQLVVSVTPTLAAKWLVPRLPAFTAAHPDTELRLLATDRVAHFQAEAVDLAVRHGRPPFGPGLHTELLFEEELVAVATPDLLARSGHPAQTGSLAGHALLHDALEAWPPFLQQVLPQAPRSAARHIRFNQTALAIDAALAGQGLALAHLPFVSADLAAGRLVRVFAAARRSGAGFYIVHPRRPRHGERLAQLRAWLLQQAAGQPPAVPAPSPPSPRC